MFIFNKMVIFVYMRERNAFDIIYSQKLYPGLGWAREIPGVDGWTREELDRFERVIRGVLQTGNPIKPIHRIKKHLL